MRYQGSHLEHNVLLYVKNSIDKGHKVLLSWGVKLEESKKMIQTKFPIVDMIMVMLECSASHTNKPFSQTSLSPGHWQLKSLPKVFQQRPQQDGEPCLRWGRRTLRTEQGVTPFTQPLSTAWWLDAKSEVTPPGQGGSDGQARHGDKI